MNNLFSILLFLFSYHYVGLSTDQSFVVSENQNMDDIPNSTEKSTNSENPEKNEEFQCNTEPSFCAKSRYRTIDGSCNNLLHPDWGMPDRPYARLLPYNYGDGINSFPTSVSGHDLPNAREIRLEIFPDGVIVDKEYTLITMQWGQIIAHDMSLTSGVPQTRRQSIACCNSNGTFSEEANTNPLCAPIHISPDDPIYGSQGKICMNFVRNRSTKNNNCISPYVPAKPLSAVTSYMDLSIIYGSSKSQADAVRAGSKGRLITLIRNGQEWPPQDSQADLNCDMQKYISSSCYFAGDIRVNQNPELALLHVILIREHNRIADALYKLNPHWDDEKLFQETRRILIAMYQRINYYEFLHKIIDLENIVKNKLIYVDVEGFINDYDQMVEPSVYSEHASAAFRIFHSSIRGHLKKYQENRGLVGEIRISDFFNNPTVLEINNDFDNFTRGLCTQLQSYSDQYFDEEVTEFLFKGSNEYGNDLRAIDIQRSRDHGLSSYVKTRAICGLSVPKTFNDMRAYMSDENVRKLKNTYECLEDVEMTVAGSLEYHIPKAQVGPTFRCIITKQFLNTRIGDRFFFENGADPDIAFTPSIILEAMDRAMLEVSLLYESMLRYADKPKYPRILEELPNKSGSGMHIVCRTDAKCQLQSIRKGASLSRLLCDNVVTLKSIQPSAFQKISPKNKLVPCDELPFVNLTLWKEEKC